eukprot:9345364-Pyramimonas_sp.AAC.1
MSQCRHVLRRLLARVAVEEQLVEEGHQGDVQLGHILDRQPGRGRPPRELRDPVGIVPAGRLPHGLRLQEGQRARGRR